ncbi:menaquinone biosynthetic enzyme MqnA/MqnD family protein [Alistipes putredinis]|uniref:menaquinone biosynthetic enzyme MqnA/MqnD family protein n=2 Tax=Alistipes putredinis TaxID=28117 RepID=UPI003A89E0B1
MLHNIFVKPESSGRKVENIRIFHGGEERSSTKNSTIWMMVSVPSIAAVSYLNTIPFIYGIRHEGNFRADLLLSPPSECTKNYVEERADLALLPAAAVPSLKSTDVITEYCIGAVGPVRTVVLLSDGPVSEVRRVFLDPHSQTSVQLVGYLAAHRWKIAPEWYSLDDYEQLRHAQEGDAFLLIGDKVFDHEEKFRYKYDLAAEWQAATKLPFAFAVWVARKGTPYEVIESLQHALTFGLEHTYEAILEAGFDKKPYDAYEYLTRNIDYIFDNQKRRALQKFWDSGLKVSPRVNPG